MGKGGESCPGNLDPQQPHRWPLIQRALAADRLLEEGGCQDDILFSCEVTWPQCSDVLQKVPSGRKRRWKSLEGEEGLERNGGVGTRKKPVGFYEDLRLEFLPCGCSCFRGIEAPGQ